MVRCVAYIQELCMTLTFDLNIKIIISPWIWVFQDVFALWHRHTKFWHMIVSPCDNMLCTFLTLVWPWPLTYMWVAGGILREYCSSFYLVFSLHYGEKTSTCRKWYICNLLISLYVVSETWLTSISMIWLAWCNLHVSIIGFVLSKRPFIPMIRFIQIYHDVVVVYSWHIH